MNETPLTDLAKDFQELKQFVADLKNDRATQKAKEAREAWTKHVSVGMVVIAVLAAVASQKSGGYANRTLRHLTEASFHQASASDQWSYYQAKSVKRHIDENELDRALQAGHGSPKLEAQIARYEKEAGEIKAGAEALEKKRDESRANADKAAAIARETGSVVSVFQVAVACGSISMVVKRKSLWHFAVVMSAYAAVRLAIVLLT